MRPGSDCHGNCYLLDLVLVAESMGELKEEVLRWKECMKVKGLKNNIAKQR